MILAVEVVLGELTCPSGQVAEFTATFDEHCREHGHGASLRAFKQQVPHRKRVRHAVAAREPGFIVRGVPAFCCA
ncbi:hypothetical protein [Micromonospora marina]|uniref:hypothetical protein n=1 Tax=Micromonospora marina TaxID=307120 RepID=UPI003D73DDF2